jgi:esterase/lipase superfamily enzyme
MPANPVIRLIAAASVLVLVAGCATPARELMPTPLLYQGQDGAVVFDQPSSQTPEIDLLYITDRGEPTADEDPNLVYGESRARRIAFGAAKVRMEPNLTWQELEAQSTLGERTQPVTLELGEVTELGAYPPEPYDFEVLPNGSVIRDPAIQAGHDQANAALIAELEQRLAASPTKEVVLYVHGFNETFATAAYTLAELCHFLGREPVCVFFTWPASHTGNFLISYTNTTESAAYAVEHLKKTIRLIGTQPDVERLHVLAHSRGTAVALDAVHHLLVESVAAGQEPLHSLKLGELVLFSPDVDMDIAAQRITGYLSDPDLFTVWPEQRVPRSLHGELTIYSSPEDRALLVSRILFRSRHRLGQLTAAYMTPEGQQFLARIGKIKVISYEGKRTDLFGHSYFTTNPEVSSDVVELLRYGKRLGEPGRELIRTGPVTWEFPTDEIEAREAAGPGRTHP